MVRNIYKGWQRAGKTHGAWVSKSKSKRREGRGATKVAGSRPAVVTRRCRGLGRHPWPCHPSFRDYYARVSARSSHRRIGPRQEGIQLRGRRALVKNACRLLPPLGLPSAQSRRERAVDPACRLSSAHALCGHDAGHRCSRPCPAGCSSTTGCPGRGDSGSGRGCCGGHRRRGRPTHIFLFPGRTQGRLVSAGLSLLCLCPM